MSMKLEESIHWTGVNESNGPGGVGERGQLAIDAP